MASAVKQQGIDGGLLATRRESPDGGSIADPATRLAPALEGARARGVADAFAMAGQAAILLGGAGEVLHTGASASALLGAGLRLHGGRLVTGDEQNRQLFDGLEVCADAFAPGIMLAAAGGGKMRVRVLPFAGGIANPAQLLKAVVLLDPLR